MKGISIISLTLLCTGCTLTPILPTPPNDAGDSLNDEASQDTGPNDAPFVDSAPDVHTGSLDAGPDVTPTLQDVDSGCLQVLVNYDRSVNLIPCGTGSGCLIGPILYGQPIVLNISDPSLCIVPYVPCNDNSDGSDQGCRGITIE